MNQYTVITSTGETVKGSGDSLTQNGDGSWLITAAGQFVAVFYSPSALMNTTPAQEGPVVKDDVK